MSRVNLNKNPSFELNMEHYAPVNAHASLVSNGHSGTNALHITTGPVATRWFDSLMIVTDPYDDWYVNNAYPTPLFGGVFRNVNQLGNLRNGHINTPDTAETLVTALKYNRNDIAAANADYLIASMYNKTVWGQTLSFIAEAWFPGAGDYEMANEESHSRTLALAAYALSEYSKVNNDPIRGITPRQAAIDLLFSVRRLQLVVADRIAGGELPSWMSGGMNEWWRNVEGATVPQWNMHSMFAQDVVELAVASLLSHSAASVNTSSGIGYSTATVRNNYRTFMNSALGRAGVHMPIGLPHQRIDAPGDGTTTFVNWYTPGAVAPNPLGPNADWTTDAMGWIIRGRALAGANIATYVNIMNGLRTGSPATLFDAYKANGAQATDGGASEYVPQAPALMYLATTESASVPVDETWLDYVKTTQLATNDARDGSWSWTGHPEDHSEAIATAIALRALHGLGWTPRITGRPYVQQEYVVEPGKTYTASAYVKTFGAISSGFRLLVEMYDNFDNWTWLNESQSSSVTDAPTWTRISTTFTAPANCTRVIFYPLFNSSANPPSAVTIDVDSVMFEEGPLGSYFDGDYAGYGWDGPAHRSTSSTVVIPVGSYVGGSGSCPVFGIEDFPRGYWILDDYPFFDYSGYDTPATVTDAAAVNLLMNPSAEKDASLTNGSNRIVVSSSTDWAVNGQRSFKCVRNSDTSPDAYLELINMVPGGRSGLKPNTTYTMVGTVKPMQLIPGVPAGDSSAALGQRLSLFAHLDGVGKGFTVGVNSTNVQTIRHKFTTPATMDLTKYSTLRAYAGGAPGDIFYWDSLMLVEGDYTGSYFDGDSPHSAWTGNPHASTSVYGAGHGFGPALSKGALRSLVVSNTHRVNYPAPIWNRGREYMPFSVEAFVRPLTGNSPSNAEQQIFGNEGHMDGITIKGTVVSFVTKYSSTGEARASFDVIRPMNMCIVGIHTQAKNSLYINGDLVAEVDITEAQQNDIFAASGNKLSSGASSGTGRFMLNTVSIYDSVLDDESIMHHYAASQDTLSAEDIAVDYRGQLLEFAPSGSLSPFVQFEYSSDEEWSAGSRLNVGLHDGTLYPVTTQGISVPGHWEIVLPLGIMPSNIYGVNLVWAGTGAVVQTSRDGELWETARNGANVTTVPRGTNGTGEFLFIRVSFPGGIADDPAYFDDLVVSFYNTGTIANFAGREVVLDKASAESDYDVIDMHEDWGLELESGTLTIKAGLNSTTSIVPKTIEVWAKKGGSTFADNLITSSPTTWRSNGQTPKPYEVGEWQLRHYVFENGFTGDIVFSGTGQIGHVILYPEALSNETIKEIYSGYVGKPKITLSLEESFDISEIPNSVDIYEYDWSIETAG